MTARVIAIANLKGGAGKSTTAQLLGVALNRFHGKKVLILDADAQGSLTITFGRDEGLDTPTLADVLEGSAAKDAVIPAYDPDNGGLYLIPGDSRTAIAEHKIGNLNSVANLLKPLEADYDYILIDCAPGLSPLTLSGLAAADEAIITAMPNYLHVSGIDNIMDAIEQLKAQGSSMDRVRVLITQMHGNTRVERETVENVREAYPDTFNTVIRHNIAIPEAQGMGKDVFATSPRSNGAKDYKALADELLSV